MSDRNRTQVRAGMLMLLAMMTMASALSGCSLIRYLTYIVAGGDSQITVTAAYRGLTNRSFAVLVAPDEYALAKHPLMVANLSRAVTSSVAGVVDGARPMAPDQIVAFQRANPFWATVPPADLIKRLKVERLLIVWVERYTLRDTDNVHTWRGVASAKIDVFESQVEDPNNAAYQAWVKAAFPADSTVGMVNANDRQIEFGMLKAFSTKVANLFVDHDEVQRP
jgi:hypothetical protein